MNFTEIIAYIEGTLSEKEKKKVEQFIFSSSNNIALFGDMNRISKSLNSDETLTAFFQKKSEKTLNRIAMSNSYVNIGQ